MEHYIDGIDFWTLETQKYYAPPASWSVDKIKDTTTSRIFSGTWLGSRKMDGAFYKFIKDEDGNMYLIGRSKSKSGDYLDKYDWVPHLHSFFEEQPNGTCFLGELYLPTNEQAKSTTTIMNCLKEKAIKRQEKEENKLHYYIFDILAWEGKSFLNKTAEDRFDELNKGWRAYGENYHEWAHYYSGKELWEQLQNILAEGGEGIVITEEKSLYQPGKRPSKQCLKVKKELQDTIDCIIMGAVPPTREYTGKEIKSWPYWFNNATDTKILASDYLAEHHNTIYAFYADGGLVEPITKNWFYGWAGSLKVGAYKDGELVQIGQLSGITDEMKQNWKELIGRPIEITAMEVMDTGGIRHPKFLRFRDDMDPHDCAWEKIFK